jgi:hypothetical protein
MSNLDKNQLEIQWMCDILYRMEVVVNSANYSENEKIEAIRWLIKQALKVDKE